MYGCVLITNIQFNISQERTWLLPCECTVNQLLNGWIAELPTILDSFLSNTTSDLYGVVGRGWWGATKWRAKHTSVTDIPKWPQQWSICALNATKSSQLNG